MQWMKPQEMTWNNHFLLLHPPAANPSMLKKEQFSPKYNQSQTRQYYKLSTLCKSRETENKTTMNFST